MSKLKTLEIIRDRIIEVVTVADLLDREGIKTRGKRCKCMLHNGESHMSFSFPDNKIFHCFGCDAKGNVVDLVMKINNIAYPEALLKLNYDFGLGLDFDKEASDEDVQKWERIKQERRQKVLLEEEKELELLNFVKFRQVNYKLGRECEYLDDILYNYKDIIKYLGIKKYERGDFK